MDEQAKSSILETENASATAPRRRRVAFRDTCTVQVVESRTSLAEKELRASYYTNEEIEGFHAEARAICKNLQLADQDNNYSYDPNILRGLELRRSIERTRRKFMTIQCILMAQKRFSDPSRLAGLAHRCSQWAAQAAVVEGQRDYILANIDGESSRQIYQLLPNLPVLTPFPLPLKQSVKGLKKRSSCGTETTAINDGLAQADRRVRQRTSCTA